MTHALVPMNNLAGPLPRTATFQTSGGGPVVLMVSGTAFKSPGMTGIMSVTVQLDGVTLGELRFYANEAFSHKTFPTRTFVVPAPPAGAHTVTLLVGAATATDVNDSYNVTVLELDPGGP